MSLISDMKARPADGQWPASGRYVKGFCAGCGKEVYESWWLLDDAYAVWVGRCPHCAALNFLAMRSARGAYGYDTTGMDLILPTAEEVEHNCLPPYTKTRSVTKP